MTPAFATFPDAVRRAVAAQHANLLGSDLRMRVDWATVMEVRAAPDYAARMRFVDLTEKWVGYDTTAPTVADLLPVYTLENGDRWLHIPGVSWCKTWTTNADFDAGVVDETGPILLGYVNFQFPSNNDELKLRTDYGYGDGRDGAVLNDGASRNLTVESASGRVYLDGVTPKPDAPAWGLVNGSMSNVDRDYITITGADVNADEVMELLQPGDIVLLYSKIVVGAGHSGNVGNYELFKITDRSRPVGSFGTVTLTLDRPRKGQTPGLASEDSRWYGLYVENDSVMIDDFGEMVTYVQRVPQYSSVYKAAGGQLYATTSTFVALCSGTGALCAVNMNISGYGGASWQAPCSVPRGGGDSFVAGHGGGTGDGECTIFEPCPPCKSECGAGGGGGGGHGTPGENGQNGQAGFILSGFHDTGLGGAGSAAYGYEDLKIKIFPGAGGGAGGDGQTDGGGRQGSDGGGVIIFRAPTISNMQFFARSEVGRFGGVGAGGGAGGSVFLRANTYGFGVDALAAGGGDQGGTANAFCRNGAGGRGGIGRIHAQYHNDPSGNLTTDITPYLEQFGGAVEACMKLPAADMEDYASPGAMGTPGSLLANWDLDGEDNIAPKFQIVGSDDADGLVNAVVFPAATDYYQAGGAYPISSGTSKNLSTIPFPARRFWTLRVCLAHDEYSTVTPKLFDAMLCGVAA